MCPPLYTNESIALKYYIKSYWMQVTTHSKLLSGQDRDVLAEDLGLGPQHISLRALQAFETEQQFCKVLRYSNNLYFKEKSNKINF